MKNYIGTCIHFDEATANRTLQAWQQLLPEIKNVGLAYEALDTGYRFTQNVWDDIITNKMVTIQNSYRDIVEGQIKHLHITSASIADDICNRIPTDLKKLSLAIDNMLEKVTKINARQILPIDLGAYKIDSGEPVLDETAIETINNKCRVIITTESQSEKYAAALEVIEAYKKLADLFYTNGQTHRTQALIGNSGLLAPIDNNCLGINQWFIGYFGK